MFGKILEIFKGGKAYCSLKGKRQKQEDSFLISERKNSMQLFLVADGVGGHGYGEFASNSSIEIFQKAFSEIEQPPDIDEFFSKNALLAAAYVYNKGIQDTTYKNAGTTLSGFFVHKNTFFTINIGDSRVYWFRPGKGMQRLTKDHTKVQNLIDNSIISEKQAFAHPERHIMTSAIGQKIELITIDIKGPYRLKKGDLLFACTDGLHGTLRDEQILSFLKKNTKSPKIARKLANLAYKNGSADNITICVYRHK